jgi:hypothetical protein
MPTKCSRDIFPALDLLNQIFPCLLTRIYILVPENINLTRILYFGAVNYAQILFPQCAICAQTHATRLLNYSPPPFQGAMIELFPIHMISMGWIAKAQNEEAQIQTVCRCASQFKKTITSIQGPFEPTPPKARHSPGLTEGEALGLIFKPQALRTRLNPQI